MNDKDKEEMRKVVNVIGFFVLAFFVIAGFFVNGAPAWWKSHSEVKETYATMNLAANRFLETGNSDSIYGGTWIDVWKTPLVVMAQETADVAYDYVEVFSFGPDNTGGTEDDLRLVKRKRKPVAGWWNKMWADVDPQHVKSDRTPYTIAVVQNTPVISTPEKEPDVKEEKPAEEKATTPTYVVTDEGQKPKKSWYEFWK